MISYSFPIWSSEAMDDTNPLASSPAWIGTAQGVAIQATWTGDAQGTFKLQASCSPVRPNTLNADVPVVIDDTEWADIPDSEVSITEAGTYVWNYDGAYYPWVRAYYTPTSGTGTVTGTANIKSDEVLG